MSPWQDPQNLSRFRHPLNPNARGEPTAAAHSPSLRSLRRAAVATPSCYGQVDEPLWRAPFPWCQPLPGTGVRGIVETPEVWGAEQALSPVGQGTECKTL